MAAEGEQPRPTLSSPSVIVDEDVELVSIASNTPNTPHAGASDNITPTGSPRVEDKNEPPSSSGKRHPVENKQFRWKKGEVTGKGAYGKVYIGLNEETGALLAVKEVDCTFEDAQQELMALRSEIDLLS